MRDPRGRRVSLEAERWEHIIDGHPELRNNQADIMRGGVTERGVGGPGARRRVVLPGGSGAEPLAQGGRGLRPARQRAYHHCIRTTKEAMSVTIADITFDRVEYDAGADVLYLHVGDPSTAVDFDETPEGHALRFDAEGRLVGITLVRPKHLLEEDGALRVTLPVPSDVPARELTPALSA